MAWWYGLVVCACVAAVPSSALADFELGDSAIEASVGYAHRPIRFVTESEPMIGTVLSVIDRNGLFAGFIPRVFGASGHGYDNPMEQVSSSTYRYLGSGTVEKTTTYRTVFRKGYETPEARAERARERMAAYAKFRAFKDYTTEFQLYVPREGLSNLKGAAFGMSASVVRNGRVAIDLGLRWQYLRADDDCETAGTPSRCTMKFFGVPLAVTVSLGRIGRLHAGIDWNWRRLKDDPNRISPYPIHLGLTTNVIDRAFLHARLVSSVESIGEAGVIVAAGVRL